MIALAQLLERLGPSVRPGLPEPACPQISEAPNRFHIYHNNKQPFSYQPPIILNHKNKALANIFHKAFEIADDWGYHFTFHFLPKNNWLYTSIGYQSGTQVFTKKSPSVYQVDTKRTRSGPQMVAKWSPRGHQVVTKWST